MVSTPRTQIRCICGMTMKLTDGAGHCSNCGRTSEDVRAYQRAAAKDRANRRGTSRELARLARQRRIEASKLTIAQRAYRDEPVSEKAQPARGDYVTAPKGVDLSQPLLPMRACHDCGVPTWDYRCPKCRGIHARRHGIEGRYDMSAAFRGSPIDNCPFL